VRRTPDLGPARPSARALRIAPALALAAALALLAAGCGATLTGLGIGAASILGKDGSSVVVNAPPSVFPLPEERSVTREVRLRFRAVDVEGDPVAVKVEYARLASLDAPAPTSYTAARVVATEPGASAPPGTPSGVVDAARTGIVAALPASRAGIEHVAVWDSSTDGLPEGAFAAEVRYIAVDAASAEPVAAPAAFRITIGNDPPAATLEVGVGASGFATGLTTLLVRLADSTRDRCRIVVEYALASSPEEFFAAEVAVGATEGLATAETLSAAPAQSVAWSTDAPPPAGVGKTNPGIVIVRVTPVDEHEEVDPTRSSGEAVTASVLVVNNLPPAVRPDLNPFRPGGSPVPISLTLFDQELDRVDVKVEVRVGDGAYVPATERPAGLGQRELSEGGSALESGPFPTGKAHRFLWDMNADVPDEGGDVRLRFSPSDPFNAGLTVEIGPLPLRPAPPFKIEPGREPGTSELVLGFLYPGAGTPTLLGVVGGRVSSQDIALPGTAAEGGFLDRIEIVDRGEGGFIDGCDAVRILSTNDGFSPIPTFVAVNRARPRERFTVFEGPFAGFDDPQFFALATISPTADAVSVADLAILDADEDEQDDIAVLYRVEDPAGPTHGWRLVVYPFAGAGGRYGPPVPVAAVVGLAGGFRTDDPRGVLLAGDLDGDGDRDLSAAFRSSGDVDPATAYLVVALNANDGLASFPDVRTRTDPQVARAVVGASGVHDVVGLSAGDLDGDGRPEVLVSAQDRFFTLDRRFRAFSTKTSGAITRLDAEVPDFGVAVVRAVADLDGDGRDEVLGGSSGPSSLLEDSVGAEVFRLIPVEGAPTLVPDEPALFDAAEATEAVAADFDEDGAVDLAVLARPSTAGPRALHVLWNDGAGRLAERRVIRAPVDMERLFGIDLDDDGDQDLVAPHPAASNALRNPRPLGVETMTAPFLSGPLGLEGWSSFGLADLDGDGRDEVVSRGASTSTLGVVSTAPDGTFVDALATEPQPEGIPFAFTRLGGGALPRESLALLDDGAGGVGAAGTRLLGPPAVPGGPPLLDELLEIETRLTITAADVNGDGRDDLVVLEAASFGGDADAVRVALRLPDGGFAPPADVFSGTERPFDVVAGDLEGDGAVDLAVALADDSTIAVLRGIPGDAAANAAAPMEVAGVVSLPGFTRYGAMVLSDVTGDGRADLSVATAFTGIFIFVQAADGTFGAAPPLESGSPTCSFYGMSVARAAALDLDGDGRREVVVCSAGFDDCDGTDELAVVTATVRPSGLVVPGRTVVRFSGLPLGSTTAVGGPFLHDQDGDGRADAVFPVDGPEGFDGFVVVSPRARGAANARFDRALRPSSSRAGDLTGDGRRDLVLLEPSEEIRVAVATETRRSSAARLIFAAAGGSVFADAAPIAGASVFVFEGSRRADRTLALAPGASFDLPPVPGAAVVGGVAARVFAPASPFLAVMPESETLSADASITIPLDLRAPALAPLRSLGDSALAATLRVFRFEREAGGGRGRAVDLGPPDDVLADADGRRVAEVLSDRFGVFVVVAAR
jgi:hypothetical protein